MTDPRNFLLNTDYPLDMIAFKTEGSFSIANSTIDSLTIPHGLGFAPMPILIWSNTADFSTAYTGGDPTYYSTFTGFAGQEYNAVSDPTNITINRLNYSGSTQTVYYRIFAFVPSTEPDTTVVPANSNTSDTFILNTDFNYMKLVATDRVTTTATTYSHNLGYIPSGLMWGVNYSGGTTISSVTQLVGGQIVNGAGGTSYVYLDSTTLTWLSPATFNAIEFRLYAETGGS